MDRINDSIVATIKKMLGLDDVYTPFDVDVIIHINAALMTLCQMGIGPKSGFTVSDYDEKWSDFLVNDVNLGAVKTYIYLQVKMLFDSPTNSFVMDAMKKQSEEILWRLNVQAESVEAMDFMRAEGLKRGANPKNILSVTSDDGEANEDGSVKNSEGSTETAVAEACDCACGDGGGTVHATLNAEEHMLSFDVNGGGV